MTTADNQPVLRFGLIADIHHADFDKGDRHCSKSLDRLNAALEWLSQRSISFLINLGDSINGCDNKNKEKEYARTIASVFASFNADIKFVLGNHDIELLSKDEFASEVKSESPNAFCHAFDRSFDCGGIRIILLDGNMHQDGTDFFPGKFSWDQAYLGANQLAWLKSELNKANGKPVLIFSHECLDYNIWKNALDPHIVKDVNSFREIVNSFSNVLAVIQGHYHPGRFMMIDGLPYMAMASIIAGDFPMQGAAATVAVMQDGSLEVEGFGRQPSLTLARQK